MMSNGGVAGDAGGRRAAGDAAPLRARRRASSAGSGPGRSPGASALITFDMGGTSADIGIVTERGITEASARDTWVGGYPLLVPMLDVHTIGAGGGSIAYVDEGGAFRVGPRSAGAEPGPGLLRARRRRSRRSPTRTSCSAGIDPERFLGGRDDARPRRGRRGRRAARRRSSGCRCSRRPRGSSRSRTRTWRGAIRSRTIEKGHDPREFALVAFGGAGPLHAAEVADSLGIPEVLVPPYPGITSAIGLLTSDLKYDQMRTVFMLEGSIDAERLNRELDELRAGAARAARARRRRRRRDRASIRALDCRYVGQGYELRSRCRGRRVHRGGARGVPPPARARVRPARSATRSRSSTSASPRSASGRRCGAARRRAATLERGARRRERERLPRRRQPAARCRRASTTARCCRSTSRSTGPAVVFQLDTTTVVPPGWTRARRPLREPAARRRRRA